ncbi:hypothetical protein THIOM_001819, partial [Candidatus Thiomargarita nelsonii]
MVSNLMLQWCNDIQVIFAEKISKLLKIQSKYKAQVIHPLDDLLDEIGLKPRFPKSSLQLMTLYDTLADFDADEEEWLRYAAHLALMLNLKVKNAPLSYDQREAALLSLIPVARPEFIQDIEDNKSRCVLTALWVITLADDDLKEAIWGDDSLLQRWLEDFKPFLELGEGDKVAQ